MVEEPRAGVLRVKSESDESQRHEESDGLFDAPQRPGVDRFVGLIHIGPISRCLLMLYDST